MASSIYRRVAATSTRAHIAPELIGGIPDDWAEQLAAGKVYVIMALADPDDPTQPVATWGLLDAGTTSETLTGWGWNWGGDWGN